MNNKQPLIIKSEEEFSELIQQIDQEMVNANVPVTARPFKAELMITQ